MASAVVVLVASGVAVSRIGVDGGRRSVSVAGPGAGPTASTGALAAGAGGGPPASGAVAGSPDGQAAARAVSASARTAAGRPAPGSDHPAAASQGHPSQGPASQGPTGQGAGSQGAGSQDAGSGGGGGRADGSPPGGQGAPGPGTPGQEPPDERHLVGASVSAGQGAAGGVVGVKVGSATPEADVTVGTSPVVGDHPPANGTGIAFSGRFFHPPPSVPVLPG